MIHHHPDNNMLLEYASGSLNWAHSLVVSAHLQLCTKCAAQYRMMNSIGGTLLDSAVPATNEDGESANAFARLMDRIESGDQAPEKQAEKVVARVHKPFAMKDPVFSDLPPVVSKLMRTNSTLKWRRLSKGLKEARLKTGQRHHEVSFHRIAPGNKVAEHDHRGKEITMVLYGSFSDADGVYTRGDFLVREPGEIHRPTATQDQECLCLSVVEAPVALTGVFGKLINPFLSIKPQ
ncbi:ChrR family anti-sigma-E factor [Microbulbifer bruguierae]|uniref:ChrR family anti-sigma-E factor n=1 Tax=Microbulbifer bruguierae TaxID=3029061 RepID=A0ABY8ND74_9GAMM|nr:ChrR family anti-sigma-E factor [Microbulbifer bruguierae]WGL16876.1 ChrR family anti-sigma-E factor [Microbulbifer bruguierae]